MTKENEKYRFWQVHDLHIWLISQRIHFSPEDRYATPDLNKAQLHASVVGSYD